MIVTEDEAKTKRCQETFGVSHTNHCMGSLCMAWRWLGWREPGFTGYFIDKPPAHTVEHVGCCGKAGHP